MQKNTYDNSAFFEKYSQMPRSQQGLEGAGEWKTLEPMLPDFTGKRVLDLGCGFGWHCVYAAQHGAASVLGLDLSENMLRRARAQTQDPQVEYRLGGIEDYDYPPQAFDVVLSSLALHYVADFAGVCQKAARTLVPGGDFVFSIEHPIFTAYGSQDWIYGPGGEKLHWPVDRYFDEGGRDAVFLGEPVKKEHHTLTTLIQGLLDSGFSLSGLAEPQPPEEMLDLPDMRHELRRPMMLLISAKKL